MEGWSARALSRQTGISASTLVLWISKGLINPESQDKGRNGHVIGQSGLLELLTIDELRCAGFSLQTIQKAIENLRRILCESRSMARFMLVIRGNDIAWLDSASISESTFSALHSPGQRLMIFPIGERHLELVEQLRKSNKPTKIHKPLYISELKEKKSRKEKEVIEW